MIRTIDKDRLKLYARIALAYVALWVFMDLFENQETFFKRVWNNIWLTTWLAMINFILYEYAIPFIRLTWKRLLTTPFMLWAIIMLLFFGLYAWRSIGVGLNLYFSLREHPSILKGVEYHAPYVAVSVLFFGVIKYTYDFRKLKETAQLLRLQKQEAELNYLKAQTNPHFLFNTLNNIYSLSRDKSDLAPESILRLSKILRFMLYETSGDFIAIEHELKIMTDYIALEKLRYDESLRVNFNHDVEDLKQSIPPLLLIPLVENAFKHGVSETRNNPFVDIHLSVNQRILKFTIRNSSDWIGEQKPVKENIGLSNLRRQLELLYRDYSLNVDQREAEFVATLKINLASHV